jgi:hypothetical protein
VLDNGKGLSATRRLVTSGAGLSGIMLSNVTSALALTKTLQPLDMVIEARTAFGSSIFREIFIAACWIIWTTRNGVILI